MTTSASCYKNYTSKINLEKIEPVEEHMNASACGLVRTSEYICVKTRSMTAPFDWSQCIFLHDFFSTGTVSDFMFKR
jgi:hypothetical protein